MFYFRSGVRLRGSVRRFHAGHYSVADQVPRVHEPRRERGREQGHRLAHQLRDCQGKLKKKKHTPHPKYTLP